MCLAFRLDFLSYESEHEIGYRLGLSYI